MAFQSQVNHSKTAGWESPQLCCRSCAFVLQVFKECVMESWKILEVQKSRCGMFLFFKWATQSKFYLSEHFAEFQSWGARSTAASTSHPRQCCANRRSGSVRSAGSACSAHHSAHHSAHRTCGHCASCNHCAFCRTWRSKSAHCEDGGQRGQGGDWKDGRGGGRGWRWRRQERQGTQRSGRGQRWREAKRREGLLGFAMKSILGQDFGSTNCFFCFLHVFAVGYVWNTTWQPEGHTDAGLDHSCRWSFLPMALALNNSLKDWSLSPKRLSLLNRMVYVIIFRTQQPFWNAPLLLMRQGHIPNVSLHPSRTGDPNRSWSISQVLLAAGALGVYVWSRRPEPKLKQDWSDWTWKLMSNRCGLMVTI